MKVTMHTAVACGTSAYFVNQNDAQVIETVAYNAANMLVARSATEAFILFGEELKEHGVKQQVQKILMPHLEINIAYAVKSFFVNRDVTDEDHAIWRALWTDCVDMHAWAERFGVCVTIFDIRLTGQHIILAAKFESGQSGRLIRAPWPRE